MSKILKVANGNYSIYVQSGGIIRLDTGIETGQVRVSGDLIVEGNTTTVQSETLVIKDNTIVVNDGETGAGITLNEAGIRADRGTEPDAKFVFDETIDIINPATELSVTGAWSLEDQNGLLLGIRTNAIATDGDDLYLINDGTGVISVTGTNNYENQVVDDDHIPNKKYVDDAISNSSYQNRIEEGSGGSITYVEAIDFEDDGSISRVDIAVDGAVVATFLSDRTEIQELRIENSSISTTGSNEDLILYAPGTGSIRIDDTLHINSVPSIDDVSLTPTAPTDGVKVYASTIAGGNTGLYFVNTDDTRDELISRSKALAYSMIF